jgi:hypothetical protein
MRRVPRMTAEQALRRVSPAMRGRACAPCMRGRQDQPDAARRAITCCAWTSRWRVPWAWIARRVRQPAIAWRAGYHVGGLARRERAIRDPLRTGARLARPDLRRPGSRSCTPTAPPARAAGGRSALNLERAMAGYARQPAARRVSCHPGQPPAGTQRSGGGVLSSVTTIRSQPML